MSLLIFVAILAFYVAWNLGANDVANSMGTSVGSKIVSLKQALLLAGILEFTGAVFFGHSVVQTLATKVANPTLFTNNPQLLLWVMVTVMLTCGIWLQVATSQGLPVASSHAIVGAIAGIVWVAKGYQAVDWHNLVSISVVWLLTPLISGAIAALIYWLVTYFLLRPSNSLFRIGEWIPWLSAILLAIFGIIVFPTIFNPDWFASFPLPEHDWLIGLAGIAAVTLTISSWNRLEGLQKELQDKIEPNDHKQALETIFGRFQLLSACFVAFAHGSNDVGNAIAPLAVITYILSYAIVPQADLTVPFWILVLGAAGIVAGLAIQGQKVIATVGEGIIALQPSSGFCAELATATTILLASRFGFPVSTSHALVGSLVGIGLVQGWHKVQFSTLKSVVLAWVVTIPLTAVMGAVIFILIRAAIAALL